MSGYNPDLAVVLDPITGRPEMPVPFDRPGLIRSWSDVAGEAILDRLPDHIRRNLHKAKQAAGPWEPRGSGLGWEEVIYHPNADGTAITSSSETILIPDISIPAGYMTVGKLLRYTIVGRQSTVITTPGTITFRIRWGGVGGVSLVASGAFAPDSTAAATNLTWMAEWLMECRAVGTSGSILATGRIEWTDYDDASAAALVANLAMRMAPTSAPAGVSVDTTIDKLLSATYQSSVTTASVQAHIAYLEALN